ncbi:TadE/TadG family type IV pilus assembly protein [uncultured Devosia sp.]|uniref:TadE/TadG family type IV pilus assembly protein n=1 Tax=uncultured Devosia sp. TaxID=211434 RepID=UPI00262C4250|nr:TadE/TadG family type IV pilus assembly protein [uncultured Devosia sp.]
MNRSSCHRIIGDERGVAAIEFALIVPIVLVMLIGMVYVNEALTVHRKLRQVTATLTDLVAQQDEITQQAVTLTMAGSASLLAPYDTTSLKLVLTVISNNGGTQTVAWSRAYQTTPESTGNPPAFPVPASLALDGVQTVAVRADFTYESIFSALASAFGAGQGLVMQDTMYERPRTSDTIELK